MDSKERKENRSTKNVDHIPLPSDVMRDVVEKALGLVVPGMKQKIMEDMENAGLLLRNVNTHYSLSQIRNHLHYVFGNDGGELLTDVLRNTLQKTHQFEKCEASEEDDNKKPVHCKYIKQALDNILDSFGLGFKQWVFDEMARNRLIFDSDNSYTVAEVYEFFESFVGKDAAELLTERLREELRSLL